MVPLPGNSARVSENDTNTRSARRPTSRFSLPGAAFCSCTYTRVDTSPILRRIAAASIVGAEA